VSLFVISVSPRDALACGGGLVSSSTAENVGEDSQRIFFSYNGTDTEVIAQIGVPSTAEDYGALLPLNAEPTLDPEPIPVEELDALDRETAPTIIKYEEGSSGGGGCVCGSGAAGSNKGGGNENVQVGAPLSIGPVSATVLKAEDGEAVRAWLDENGFALPASGEALVDEYSGPGRYFIAIRRSETAGPSSATSIGVHYRVPGDGRALPLRFARLGGEGTQAFTVFVVSDSAVGPTGGFASLTLSDLDGQALRHRSYRWAVEDAVTAHGGKAFVLESVTRSVDVYGVGDRLSRFIGPFTKVTRLSTIVTSLVDNDARFDVPFIGDVPSSRVARLDGGGGSNRLYLTSGLAFGAALFGRKRRRPAR
jgi:hypothetical protein